MAQIEARKRAEEATRVQDKSNKEQSEAMQQEMLRRA